MDSGLFIVKIDKLVPINSIIEGKIENEEDVAIDFGMPFSLKYFLHGEMIDYSL